MSTRLLRMCFTQLIEKWKACCPPQTYQHSRFPMLVKPFQANAQCSALRSWESKYQGIGPKIGYPHVESILPSVLQSAQHLPEKTQILFFLQGTCNQEMFCCEMPHTPHKGFNRGSWLSSPQWWLWCTSILPRRYGKQYEPVWLVFFKARNCRDFDLLLDLSNVPKIVTPSWVHDSTCTGETSWTQESPFSIKS